MIIKNISNSAYHDIAKSGANGGIAYLACKELISIAHKSDPTLTVTAKTAPECNASTKILEKNNFAFIEIVQDEEIGTAWLWDHIRDS